MCTEHTNLWDPATWDREFGSLPGGIQHGLKEYDPRLNKHLADYSNFCHGDQRVFEEEIGRIFCPQEYHRCGGWKDAFGGECLKARCRHKYTLYAMISRGIYKMHTGCIQNKMSPAWNEVIEQYIILSNKTDKQRLRSKRSPIDSWRMLMLDFE